MCARCVYRHITCLQDGGIEGLFLVRKKDTAQQGSFKMKPVGRAILYGGVASDRVQGERPVYRSWVLSYVKGGKFVHNLIEQKKRDATLNVGAFDTPVSRPLTQCHRTDP